MKKFQYKYGDRPLDGYTIQRAAGRGGFGEVYYALSDSGRQVALKEIQNYEQIELRGVSQCMNLKNPHLVSIFDVKYNQDNHPFVIMEYVSGVSLRDLLNDSPSGLGTQKSAFFLREIAKGLSFLHECGIVHRDLKPGNIFYENGYVKIGDYGLTKAISTSQHTGQTITVGTVHYMAPEIGAGCYDRSIDIYALGILLYEMLTGQVPFFGASPGEILMKHMSAEPELDNIEQPFARVIRKALSKDPADRYQSVQEMVEDVFGSESIRNSVSQFSPEALSIVAQRVAQKAKLNTPHVDSSKTQDKLEYLGQRIGKIGDRIANKVNSQIAFKSSDAGKVAIDPINPKQRRTLALIAMSLISLGAGLILQGRSGQEFISVALMTFLMIGAASKTILLSKWDWLSNLEDESTWLRRFATGTLAGLAATLVGVIFCQIFSVPEFGDQGLWILLSLTVVLSLTDWWKITVPDRSKRVSLEHAFWLGLYGFIASAITDVNSVVIMAVLAGTSLVVQITSGFAVNDKIASAVAGLSPHKNRKKTFCPRFINKGCSVWPYARLIWIIASVLTFGFGLMMLIMAGVVQLNPDQFALATSCGVCSLIISVFCFFKSFCRVFTSWYRYLIKPMLLLVFLMTVVTASICMGNLQLDNDEFLVALFFIIFPAILFFVVALIPSRTFETHKQIYSSAKLLQPSPFKRVWALLLSGGIFLGLAGLHRFYVGKIGTGILWFFTGGFFGFGQLIDIIMILTGQFKDSYGRRLTIWENENELKETPYVNKPTKPQNSPDDFTSKSQTDDSGNDLADEPSTGSSTQIIMVPSDYQSFNPIGLLFSFIGYTFLFLAIILGLVVALHLPAIVAAGLPDPIIAKEMDSLFGYSGWPGLLERIFLGVVVLFLMIATICVIIARRKSGPVSIIRAVVGISGLLFALLFFSDAMPRQYSQETIDMLKSQSLGPALERLFRSAGENELIFALILVLASAVILVWPPKQNPPVLQTVAQNQEVAS